MTLDSRINRTLLSFSPSVRYGEDYRSERQKGTKSNEVEVAPGSEDEMKRGNVLAADSFLTGRFI
ncbi:hypothetical protein [Paenibacillus lutrae]|uniref:Uncharacterized protein n=1 Tax=Paenibacillus lutrae TaxID=2078573 RepID=A0A7X3JZS7_9BACL|nr:hypothetical protein [Paenibacillus lutrae]MVP00246.1 hypothetical protein [Paenibacillus lutrae]